MNDDDGFTMVDETFGVREASDCSEAEEENSLHLQKTLPKPVQRASKPVATPAAQNTPAAQLPRTSSSDNHSSARPTVTTGITRDERQQEATMGGNGMVSRHSTDPQISDVSDKLNNTNVFGADQTPSVPAAAACAHTSGWQRFHQKARAAVGFLPAEKTPEDVLFEPSASREVRSNEELNCNQHTNDMTTKTVTSSSCVTARNGPAVKPLQKSETGVLSVIPASPGALIQEAIVASGVHPNRAQTAKQDVFPMKTLAVRLLPGDCAFSAVVSRDGAGSVASVQDLERELQQKLRLRQPISLTSVQVRKCRCCVCLCRKLARRFVSLASAVSLPGMCLSGSSAIPIFREHLYKSVWCTL